MNKTEYMKKMRELFYMRRRTKQLLERIYDYHEDEFNKSLKEYNSHYVEREKYDKMFLAMDSNITRIIKRLKKEDKKNTLK